MAPKSEDTRPPLLSQDEFAAMLTNQIKDAVRFALVQVLEAEVTLAEQDVSRVELGAKSPSLRTIARLARALQTTPRDLLAAAERSRAR